MTETDDLLKDAEDFVLRRQQQRTHYDGCRTEHVECLISDLKIEIERLRLTKKERKAIAFAAEHFGAFKNQAATLLGILERLK